MVRQVSLTGSFRKPLQVLAQVVLLLFVGTVHLAVLLQVRVLVAN